MIRLRRAVSDTDPTTDLLKNTSDAVGVTCGHTNAPTENPGRGQQSGRLRRVLRGPTRRYQKERLRPSGVTSLVSQVYRCPKKTALTVAHSILVIAWYLLSRGEPYADLGADYFVRRQSHQAYRDRLVRQLERMGHKVTLEPTAA
jgi:hypothetical protein